MYTIDAVTVIGVELSGILAGRICKVEIHDGEEHKTSAGYPVVIRGALRNKRAKIIARCKYAPVAPGTPFNLTDQDGRPYKMVVLDLA